MKVLLILAIPFVIFLLAVTGTVTLEDKKERMRCGIASIIAAIVGFFAIGMAIRANHNAWYSSAADKLMAASVKAMEEGREADVLREWKAMDKKFRWQYETKGDFRKIAEEAIEGMSGNAK